jgi:hypothetical protein
MSSLLILFACTGSTAPSDPKTPAPSEAAIPAPAKDSIGAGSNAPADDSVYVLASSLNLRVAPDASAGKKGTLTVNSPLEVLEQKDDWARVRARNGTEGWVVGTYLSDRPLHVDQARAEAAKAAGEGDAHLAVSWWQRAAAIDDAPEVLEGLAAAYEAAGQTAAAAQVRSQLQWPARMLFLRPGWGEADDEVRAIWRVAFDVGGDGPIPRSKWASMGLDPEEPWWVLPAEGPAIPAEVTGFARGSYNECAGDAWVSVTLKLADAGQAEQAVLAHRGDPPESWTTSIPGSRPTRASALALVKEDARSLLKAPESVNARLVATEGGWMGSVWWETGEYTELGAPVLKLASVEVAQDVVLGEPRETGKVPILAAVRDVTGDGAVEQVFSGSCEAYVLDVDGKVRARTPYGCCGC